MDNKFYDLLVVMPVGPACKPEYIIDSLDSLRDYCGCKYKTILADDSQKGTGRLVKTLLRDVDVVETCRQMGKSGGLYLTLCKAFRYALARYRFNLVLRMDTDALIIGANPEAAAMELFRSQPLIGMAGQYPLTYDGEPWDISYPLQQVNFYTSSRRPQHKTVARAFLWPLYRLARRHGYRTGESVFGGAYFFSEACLRSLYRWGLLPLRPLGRLDLEEDHLFSLLVRAVGFGLGDLSSGMQPMGCAWKGLPAAPEELISRNKKIIHSTRFFGDLTERDIRHFFSDLRTYRVFNPSSEAEG